MWRFGEWMLEHVHIIVYTGVVFEAIGLAIAITATFYFGI